MGNINNYAAIGATVGRAKNYNNENLIDSLWQLLSDGAGQSVFITNGRSISDSFDIFLYTGIFAPAFGSAQSQGPFSGATVSNIFTKAYQGNCTIVLVSSATETLELWGRLSDGLAWSKIQDIPVTGTVFTFVSDNRFVNYQIRNLNAANTYSIYVETVR